MTLLLSPEQRPQRFFRGYDVYDPVKVGFISDNADAAEVGLEFITTLEGNSNQGHDFGTKMSQSDKKNLIEYLKTL